MPRISIRTAPQASDTAPDWLSGAASVASYCDGPQDPVHLAVATAQDGAALGVLALGQRRLGYVWAGAVDCGGVRLAAGSSFVVAGNGRLTLAAAAPGTRLVVFSCASPGDAPASGAHAHLLPVESVPRIAASGAAATSGGLHADGKCPGCGVWLNENSLPGMVSAPAPEAALKGVHAHPEDEIIFVTGGSLRLGNRLAGAGTALAIAADTLYGFTPGPDGASFITFRPTGTTAIRFAGADGYGHSAYFDPIRAIPHQPAPPAA